MSANEKLRNLEKELQATQEELLDFSDIEDLRQEVLERQNRKFRAVARELREIRNNNGQR